MVQKSQNGWGWKGPLQVFLAKALLKQGLLEQDAKGLGHEQVAQDHNNAVPLQISKNKWKKHRQWMNIFNFQVYKIIWLSINIH